MSLSTHQPEHTSLRFGNARPEIDHAEESLIEAMKRLGYSDAARFAVRLALEEAIVNAFVHGHQGQSKSVPIELVWQLSSVAVELSVTDQGPGFDPATIPDPTLDENIEKTSGRGLMLIRSFMSDVRHELGGRRLVMRYVSA